MPAATAAAPALTVSPAKSALEYENVHCRPATWLGEGVLRDTFSETFCPGETVPDDNDNVV